MPRLNKFKVGDIYKAKNRQATDPLIFIVTKVQNQVNNPLVSILLKVPATGEFSIASTISAETINTFYMKIS